MEELAGDKRIIRKRTTRCILPRQRPRDRSRTLCSNLIIPQIQAFQGGVDLQHLGNNCCPRRAQPAPAPSLDIQLLQSGVGLQRLAEGAHAFISELVSADAETFQRGADQTVKKRAEEGK